MLNIFIKHLSTFLLTFLMLLTLEAGATMEIRPAMKRGHADHGWLNTYHTFSFADYYDPKHMGFATLRVINEDRITGGSGFHTHSHKDMEIVTYVIEGALQHKDSMGNTSIILPDEVQLMSAGSGIQHSEFNHLKDKPTHLLQIWILPEAKGLRPGYGQKSFKDAFDSQDLVLVVSKDGREGSIKIHQEADLYVGKLKSSRALNFKIRPGRRVWIQMIKGELHVNDVTIKAGDGLAIEDEGFLAIKTAAGAEFILFDLK